MVSAGGSETGGSAAAKRNGRSRSPRVRHGVDDAWGFATKAIHAGQEPDPQTGSVVPPLVLGSTFAQRSPGQHPGVGAPGSYGEEGFDYARTTNPTRGQYEQALAACEQARHCIAFASGMAAISAVATALLFPGQHCIVVDDAYSGTQRLFRHAAEHFGVTFSLCDVTEPGTLKGELAEHPSTKMIWIESPTNPTLKICDIKAIAEVAHHRGCITTVDNTFASPVLQNPLALGAQVVVHSATKYIGGHSDVVGGAVLVDDDSLAQKLRHVQNALGAVPSPFDCYLALRGLKTLKVRMKEHLHNAQAVAEFLEGQPAVERVIYPGLKSHPQHALASQQMRGFGGIVTFHLKGDIRATRAFLEALRIFTLAESLGAVESLAEAPAVMTHHHVPREQRLAVGITDGMVRLSVGIEDEKDLLDDLRSALSAAADVAAAT